MTQYEPTSPDLQLFADIDRLVHEQARLMILAVLSVVENADFIFVMRQTRLTKGNLSSHMGKLEEAGYVEIQKEFVDKIPRTLLHITGRGRDALQSYRQTMLQILGDLPGE